MSSYSSTKLPSWIKSASNNWISNRTVWASLLYSQAASKAMSRTELKQFSIIQKKWLNCNAEICKNNFRESLILSGNPLALGFEKQVDWDKNPRVLLYGSTIQGTAQKGGDADFALCFPASAEQMRQDKSLLVEPPRFIQRTLILPTFFSQLGETFPAIEELTGSEAQTLHVDRVYHARVPILHFVPKNAILSKYNNNNNHKNSTATSATTSSSQLLPRFDVAACTSGCKNSHVLRFYFSQSRTLRILFLALKRWVKHRSHLNHNQRRNNLVTSYYSSAKTTSLNSYSLAIMLIYWAQERQRGVLIDRLLETEEDVSWYDSETSPLIHAEKSFLGIQHDSNADNNNNTNTVDDLDGGNGNSLFHQQQFIEEDNQKDSDKCVASLVFDFFLFYSEIFDRDTQVVDIRGSSEIGKVTSRSEWKEKVNQQFSDRDLRVFGLETDVEGKPVNHKNVNQSSLSTIVPVSESEQRKKEFDIVMKHLYGHDVICVRDPVEPHSVTRNLDFFTSEALWEEFKLAVNCCDPVQLLGDY